MLNIIQLKNISKDEVIQKISDIVYVMNTHQFDKLKSNLNKMGVFDYVRK